MLVDLHFHTCFSDGTMTPEEAVQKAAALSFGVLAAADHNTDESWPRFSAACRELGIRPIRGMEIDCSYDGRDLHLLAYGFSPTPVLAGLAAKSRGLLLQMSDDLIQRLAPRYPDRGLTVEECRGWPFDPAAGGWQCLQYLLAKGVTATLAEGMALYPRFGCDYSRYPFPPIGDVIEAVHGAGGRAVLAHPCNWFDAGEPEALAAHLNALTGMGLDGIECYYPANSPEMTAFCCQYCRERGMLITAGSDDHGAFGKNHHGLTYYMGAVRVELSQLVLKELLESE